MSNTGMNCDKPFCELTAAGCKRCDEEAHAAAIKASRAVSKFKSMNITIDSDLVDKLNEVCGVLANQWGFRPTQSQAIRHMIFKEISK